MYIPDNLDDLIGRKVYFQAGIKDEESLQERGIIPSVKPHTLYEVLEVYKDDEKAKKPKLAILTIQVPREPTSFDNSNHRICYILIGVGSVIKRKGGCAYLTEYKGHTVWQLKNLPAPLPEPIVGKRAVTFLPIRGAYHDYS
jgi:hypothetical protein